MINDLSFAIRSLRHNPGFALVAVISLALAIGADTTVYGLAEALVLRPAPLPEPQSLMQVVTYVKGEQLLGYTAPGDLSFPEYQDLSKQNKSFESLTGFKLTSFGFATQKADQPQVRYGLAATGSFFRTLKISPVLGRLFGEREDQVPGRDPVVVLTNGMWQRDFGGRADVINSKIWLTGVEFTVIGVTSRAFQGTDQFLRPGFIIPMIMSPRLEGLAEPGPLAQRDNRGIAVRGRLKPEVRVQEAAAETAGFFRQFAVAYPATNRLVSASVKSERQVRIEQDPYDAMLVSFMLALALVVLLIACANIANLCLSRGKARAREVAVRLAIGAGRGRLIRQLLVESLVIAVIGGTLGLLLAQFGVAEFARIDLPSELPMKLDVRIDTGVLWFTALATMLSAVLFGLFPAIQASKSDLVTALKDSPEGAAKRSRLFGRSGLVIAQVGGSLVLLVIASQIYKGMQYVLHAPMGFRSTGLIMASFNPKLAHYSKQRSETFYRELLRQAREIPGTRSAALGQYTPMSNGLVTAKLVVAGYDPGQGVETVTAISNTVSDGYFDTIGIPVIKGRGFTPADNEKSPPVVVVNEEFARKYLAGGNVLGKTLRADKRDGQRFEIVGVAKQSKYAFPFEPPIAVVYFALPQHPQSSMALFAQSEGPSAALADPLRQLIHGIDPGMPVLALRTIEEYCESRSTVMINLLTGTFAAMAGIGVLLAVVGLYGLMSFNVARRSREIGIRMAIGANRPDVVRMVMKQGLTLTGIGLVVGLAISLGLSRFFTKAVEAPSFDVPLVGWALLGMLSFAGLGALLPAMRASKVDPVQVMRQD